MAKPENFSKIDAEKFKIHNTQFRIELDYDNPDNVWVFCDEVGSMLGRYCVNFKIDWKRFKITMRKCLLGGGDMGEDIFIGALFDKINYQTPNDFIKLLSAFIENAHRNSLFQK